MHELATLVTPDGPRVDSRQLSPALDTRHRDTLALIRRHAVPLQDLGRLPFEKETLPTAGGPQQSVFALLNEDQCYFLLTLVRNSDRAVALKLNLVKAFRDARAQLAQRDVARLEGKTVRRAETDSIAALVEYAKGQGSENADRYYTNITRMTNELLGIAGGVRDHLDARMLKQLAVIETVVDIAIRDGIKAELPYKSVRALAKDRASGLMTALGAS